MKELQEEKQARLAPFVHSVPKLEESLATIADCLKFFMLRQQELDRLEMEQREQWNANVLAGRTVNNG